MSGWTWYAPSGTNTPTSRPPQESPGYIRTAPHLRGRVRKEGRLWFMDVINTHTGVVIATDNCIVWRKTIDGANHMTAAARGAWTHAYRQKDLR